MSKDKSFQFVPSDDVTVADVDDLELALEDTLVQKIRGLPVKARETGTGYNPYDTVPAKPRDEPKRPTDLRKLSEWIRLRRQVEALKKDDPKKSEPQK